MTAKSYTQYSVHKKCGAQYKFKYIQRLDQGKTSASAARGTGIHAWVEKLLEGEIDEFPTHDPDTGDPIPLAPYQDFFLGLRKMGTTAELPFFLNEDWEPCEKEDAWVRGYIDVFTPPDPPARDTLYIYELKTGKVWPDHVDQRHFYGTVGLAITPEAERVKVVGTYLDQLKNDGNVYERAMLRTYQYMWKGRMAQLDNEATYVPNPGFHCTWCPYSRDKGGPCKFSGQR